MKYITARIPGVPIERGSSPNIICAAFEEELGGTVWYNKDHSLVGNITRLGDTQSFACRYCFDLHEDDGCRPVKPNKGLLSFHIDHSPMRSPVRLIKL